MSTSASSAFCDIKINLNWCFHLRLSAHIGPFNSSTIDRIYIFSMQTDFILLHSPSVIGLREIVPSNLLSNANYRFAWIYCIRVLPFVDRSLQSRHATNRPNDRLKRTSRILLHLRVSFHFTNHIRFPFKCNLLAKVTTTQRWRRQRLKRRNKYRNASNGEKETGFRKKGKITLFCSFARFAQLWIERARSVWFSADAQRIHSWYQVVM